jgi:hypothetical protein
MPSVPTDVFDALNLGPKDRAQIGNILAAYDRTNAMALVALSALQVSLTGKAHLSDTAAGPAPAPPVAREQIPLPHLPALTELPVETAALVTALNGFGTKRQNAVLASMYRHLAHWPAYLGFAWLLLAPLDAEGRLQRAIDATRAQVRQHALRLAGRMEAAPASSVLTSAIAGAIESFVSDVILKMTVICALLHDVTLVRETPRQDG